MKELLNGVDILDRKKAVLYVRVSTEEQVDNFSLGTQEELCTKEATRRGYEVSEIFKEEGRSAKTIVGRPILIELLEYCRRNKRTVRAVFVYRLDRISRQTADYLIIRKKLAGIGISLISATEPTGDSPTEKLIETMLAGFAQLDNDVRSERARNGLRARFLSGLISGKAPLGYMFKDGYIIKDPKSFDHVQKAWDLMATGTKNLKEMAGIINEWGVRETLGGKEYNLRAQTVNRIFRMKFYMGILTSKKYPEEVKGQHPSMITEEKFYQVQTILDGRNRNFTLRRSRNNPDFPLRRITKCGKCGIGFTGAWSKGKCARYGYYFCRNRCVGFSIPKKDVEDTLLELLDEVTTTPPCLDLFIVLLRKMYFLRLTNLKKRKDIADAELRGLYELRQALIEKNLLGLYSDEMFREQNKLLEEKIRIAQLSKSDAILEKYNLEAITSFTKEKFKSLSRTYVKSKLPQKNVLLCSIFPSGTTWSYPGYSNTHISPLYQAIRKPREADFAQGGEGGIRTREGVTLTRFPSVRTSPLCDPSNEFVYYITFLTLGVITLGVE